MSVHAVPGERRRPDRRGSGGQLPGPPGSRARGSGARRSDGQGSRVAGAGSRRIRPASPSGVPGLLRRWRRGAIEQRTALAALVLLSVLLCGVGLRVGLHWFPPSVQALPLLGGGLLLRRRPMRALFLVVAGSLAVDVAVLGWQQLRPGALFVVAVTGLSSYGLTSSREQTGLGGLRADSVLGELGKRLAQQGRLPVLPTAWRCESVVRPAGEGPFAGDFVVSARTSNGARLELALVDVSGKGVAAGTRALLLSGALGGLLGSKDPEGFLPAANAYLLRQEWDEGFATAVHVCVDLPSGGYSVTSAGHPPIAHFAANTGRWTLLEASGVALGLLPDETYEPARGRLGAGDALLMYTDGLVEIPGRDLSVGIDKLLGEAERLVPRGFAGGADRLVASVSNRSPDDRGLVLLWRTG